MPEGRRRTETAVTEDLISTFHIVSLWRAAYAPGDGQTSPAYPSNPVQCTVPV